MATSRPDIEAITENGKCVYTLSWEVDSPCGAGSGQVFLLDGVYAVYLDEGECFGPYETLKDAIAKHEQLYWISEGTTDIESCELGIEEIKGLLKPFEGLDKNELTLRINGEKLVIKIT